MINTSKMRYLLHAILRILQRPKVLMFLSVITVCFFLNRSNNPVALKAHVNFKGIERSVSFEKGDNVLKLLHLVMIAFGDVGLNEVPPASLYLLKYDESIQDYVRLPLDRKHEGDIAVTLEHSNANGKKSNGPELPHPVMKNTPYRLWNPATTSLLQLDSNNIISCNGSFKDMDYKTVATTTGGSTFTGYGLVFNDTLRSKTYILNATDGGKSVEAVEHTGRTIKKSMKFKPTYYWSFTVFKSSQYKTMYLGCGNDGQLLLPMNNVSYPDPRTLFITNEYVPIRYLEKDSVKT